MSLVGVECVHWVCRVRNAYGVCVVCVESVECVYCVKYV